MGSSRHFRDFFIFSSKITLFIREQITSFERKSDIMYLKNIKKYFDLVLGFYSGVFFLNQDFENLPVLVFFLFFLNQTGTKYCLKVDSSVIFKNIDFKFQHLFLRLSCFRYIPVF